MGELTKEELIRVLKQSDYEATRPAAVRELFNMQDDLTLKTETPPRMVMPLVLMRLVAEASKPNREKHLLEVFIEEFDRRMVSYNRKGRLELLGALQSLMETEGTQVNLD